MVTKKSVKKISSKTVSTKKITKSGIEQKPTKNTVEIQPTPKTKYTLKIETRNQKLMLVGIILVALFALAFYFKSFFIVATVNNKPIWRTEIIKELEKSYGKAVIDVLVIKNIIDQEAQKKGILATEEEVNIEIDKSKTQLKSQGQDLEQILSLQGYSIEDYKQDVRYNVLVSKLSGASEASVSATELDDYMETNKDFLANSEATEEENRKMAQDDLLNQKRNSMIQNWLANVKQGSKIQNFREY